MSERFYAAGRIVFSLPSPLMANADIFAGAAP